MEAVHTQGKYLVIAWSRGQASGNAAGLAIVSSMAGQVTEDVEIRYVDHLGPELVDDVAAVDHVLFIYTHAHPSWPQLVVEEVEPAAAYSQADRYEDPAELIALSQVLYHRRPSAWLIAMHTFDTDSCGQLCRRGLQMADAVRRVLLSILPSSATQAPLGALPRF